ncbi:MAG: metalloregulator ArsR/SmtB family transcription factor [Pseudomonadota bacterium]
MDSLLEKDAASAFSALGSESRISVLVSLVRMGSEGLSFGQLQSKTGIPPATLSHHLKTLVDAGLVDQERRGRVTLSRANFQRLKALSEFFLEKCCLDQVQSGGDDVGARALEAHL